MKIAVNVLIAVGGYRYCFFFFFFYEPNIRVGTPGNIFKRVFPPGQYVALPTGPNSNRNNVNHKLNRQDCNSSSTIILPLHVKIARLYLK